MANQKLSDAQIAITIVPRRARWPEPGASSVWAAAHRCVDGWHDLVRKVDLACAEAEEDNELSLSGLARRRAQLYDQAMITLGNLRPLEVAEKAITENVVALERLDERNPDQVQIPEKLTKAIADLREGVEATKRALAERCKMRQSISA